MMQNIIDRMAEAQNAYHLATEAQRDATQRVLVQETADAVVILAKIVRELQGQCDRASGWEN